MEAKAPSDSPTTRQMFGEVLSPQMEQEGRGNMNQYAENRGPRGRTRGRRGFSMLEILVGLFLLVTSLMSVLALSTAATKMSMQASARAVASQIARHKLDEVSIMSQSNRNLGTDMTFEIPDDAKMMFPGGVSTSRIVGVYSVSKIDGSPFLQKIDVTVRWRNMSGSLGRNPMSSVTLSRIVAAPGSNVGTNVDPDDPTTELWHTPPPPPPPPAPPKPAPPKPTPPPPVQPTPTPTPPAPPKPAPPKPAPPAPPKPAPPKPEPPKPPTDPGPPAPKGFPGIKPGYGSKWK